MQSAHNVATFFHEALELAVLVPDDITAFPGFSTKLYVEVGVTLTMVSGDDVAKEVKGYELGEVFKSIESAYYASGSGERLGRCVERYIKDKIAEL